MADYDSSEEVDKRKSQEDPIIMYLIVRESLNMSIGKAAAQCAHASQMLQLKYNQMSSEAAQIAADSYKELPEEVEINNDNRYDSLFPKIMIFEEWLSSSFRKVVLKADDKEFAKVKEAFENSMVLVINAGLTQVLTGSETCIGLFPMKKSEAPKIIKRLQLL
jgi:peptidyl-tRNA hydrolase